jgi:hypothetical protein
MTTKPRTRPVTRPEVQPDPQRLPIFEPDKFCPAQTEKLAP